MFTCSSGVSFLRNFPKNRVHDAASHSLSLCFVYISDVLLHSVGVLVNPSVFSIVLSFACGDGGVVGCLFLFLLLCIGVIRGGLFCMVSERI